MVFENGKYFSLENPNKNCNCEFKYFGNYEGFEIFYCIHCLRYVIKKQGSLKKVHLHIEKLKYGFGGKS